MSQAVAASIQSDFFILIMLIKIYGLSIARHHWLTISADHVKEMQNA